MSAVLQGPVETGMERDQVGHRDYSISWLVITDDPNDGPTTLMATPGLPSIGSPWIFGNDVDPWALCWPNFSFTPVVTKEPNYWWIVGQKFSTRPIQRCQDTSIENPLSEPYNLSGSFIKRTKIADTDMNGNPIRSSSQQRFTSGVTEVDDNRPTVIVSFNQLFWPGQTAVQMIDTVNDSELWGLPPRCIKLGNASWVRKIWGTCNIYFTVTYEFELIVKPDPVSGLFIGWDKYIQDRGTRCLIGYSPGYWKVDNAGNLVPPANQIVPTNIDPSTGKPYWKNPLNYEAFKMSSDGEPTECFLDGVGRPVKDPEQAGKIFLQYYPQNNFLELNIPVDLNINLFP